MCIVLESKAKCSIFHKSSYFGLILANSKPCSSTLHGVRNESRSICRLLVCIECTFTVGVCVNSCFIHFFHDVLNHRSVIVYVNSCCCIIDAVSIVCIHSIITSRTLECFHTKSKATIGKSSNRLVEIKRSISKKFVALNTCVRIQCRFFCPSSNIIIVEVWISH